MKSPAAIPFDRVRAAPRHVAAALVVRLCINGLTRTGSGVAFVTTLFFHAFGVPAAIADLRLPDEPLVHVTGEVSSIELTNLSINKQRVTAVSFSYPDGDARRAATSYVTGAVTLVSGAAVDVDLVAGRPDTAVIAGMRRTQAPTELLVLGIGPLIGLLLLLAGIVKGVRHARLLREGEAAMGKLVERLPTGSRIGRSPVVDFVFSFKTRRGEQSRTTVRTHDPRAILDSKEEPLFYDPAEPSRAVLLGVLPGDPRVDDEGAFTAPASAFLLLLWPVSALCMVATVLVAAR